MAISIKAMLAAAGCAALLGGCATGPYYQDYGYGAGYGYGYGGPAYYGYPGYVGPSVGVGVGSTYYYERDDDYRRRGDRHWRGDGRRDGPVVTAPDDYRGGMRDHKGDPIGPGYRPPPGSESPG